LIKDKVFSRWVIAIPVLNILMDITMNFFPNFKTPIGVFRLAFMLGAILFFIFFYGLKKTKLNKFIVFYSVFILVLTLFTSNLEESFIDGFLKITISLFMIPLGIRLGQIRYDAILKPMIWVIGILLLNYILSQFFKLGVSVYEEDSFYKGGATASAPIIIALGVLVIYNAFNKRTLPYAKWIVMILVIAGMFVILLSVKRGAILALGVGLVFYFFNTSKKVSSTLRLGFIVLGLLIVGLQNSDVFESRVAARSTERNEFQNENRFKETVYVIEELGKSNIVQVVFGKEAFNSGVVMTKYFGRPRQLHIDYNLILLGTGVLGLMLFMFLYKLLYTTSKKLRVKSLIMDNEIKNFVIENYALILACITLSLVMSISGGLQFVSYRVMLFLIIGCSIGEMQRKLHLTKEN